MKPSTLVAALVLASIAFPASAADLPELELVDLSQLLPEAVDTAAYDISPAGLVVGSARLPDGDSVVARWTAGSGVTLDSIYGAEYGQGISDSGLIVGTFLGTSVGWYYRDAAFDCIPLPDPCGSINNLWRASSGRAINSSDVFTGAISPGDGQPADAPVEAYLGRFAAGGSVEIERLGDYLGADTAGWGINDAGDVVGVSGSGLDVAALLFRGGQVVPLPTLGGGYDWAEAINNQGIAAGISSHPDPGPWPYDAEAVLWDTHADPIAITPLGRLPGHRLSRAVDLNDAGAAVGYSVDADFLDQRAVLWADGAIVDLNSLLPPGSDWRLEVATGINEAGAIVGYGRRADLPGQRAFLLRPSLLFGSHFESGDLSEWTAAELPSP